MKSLSLMLSMAALAILAESSPANATVIVVITSPYVYFTTDASGYNNPFEVDASRSYSSLGDPLYYAWDFKGLGTYTDSSAGLTIVPFGTFTSAFTGSSFSLCTRVSDSSSTGAACAVAVDSGVAESAVPEPSTWVMLLLGFAGIGFSMRRKKETVRQIA